MSAFENSNQRCFSGYWMHSRPTIGRSFSLKNGDFWENCVVVCMRQVGAVAAREAVWNYRLIRERSCVSDGRIASQRLKS